MQLDFTTMEDFHVLLAGFSFVEWLFAQLLMHAIALAIVRLPWKPEVRVDIAGTKGAYKLEWIQVAFLEVDRKEGNHCNAI